MPHVLKIPPNPPANRPTTSSWCAAGPIHLYGWDSRSETWHGPNELERSSLPDKRLLQALRAVSGKSWYGPLHCRASGEPEARFFALVHDLSDCVIASLYCDESKSGPAEILAVIPARWRAQLRDDFAFEFLTYTRFLGSISAGAELQVHDALTSAIADPNDSGSLVFSISSGMWPSDLDHVLSRCIEKVAVSLCLWCESDSAG